MHELMATHSSTLYESYADVPASWYDVCARDDLGMDLKLLEVFQRTLTGQCRCWALIVVDAEGVAVGCAALSLFPVEIIETNSAVFIRFRRWIRTLWPTFLQMQVLFCGLPVPAGSTHVRMYADAASITSEIDRQMQLLAKKTRARLLIFKELESLTTPLPEALKTNGYVAGEIPPLHLLDISFADFSTYLAALKNRYRAQILRSQKKLSAAGFEIIHGRGTTFVEQYFDIATYQLYVEVQRRAKQKLELLPYAFFTELAAELDEEIALTLIRRGNVNCAFTFSITRGTTHYNMYSGLDYALNNEGDLYFNLFYHDMDQAFKRGVTSLHLGQTSDSFKSRLGSYAQPLWFLAKSPNALINKALHVLAPLIFPKVMAVENNDVFTKKHA